MSDDHADRVRWNGKYAGREPSFRVPDAAARALELAPDGPVLDLACGVSGLVLDAAGRGRDATGVDVSDVALGLLAREAARRGVAARVTLVHADLAGWTPPGRFALVAATGFWDRAVFDAAVRAVAPGGVLAWEAFTLAARRERPALPRAWCLADDEPAALLDDDFTVLAQEDRATKRRLLARR